MTQDFFTPKFSGARFREHTVPAELLADVAALQELLVELAKAAYLESHPERSRAPKNFNDKVQIHLAAVEDGSSKLKLVLFFVGLFSEFAPSFQTAQTQLTEAIAAVARGEQPALNSKYLAYFDRVGRGLREGESLDFPSGRDSYVPLNQDTRRALIQASEVVQYRDHATLRVRVPMTDYRSEKYSLELLDGSVVQGKFDATIYDQMEEAHVGYRRAQNDWLLVKGLVWKERVTGRITEIASVDSANPLDPLDVSFRLEELSKLEDGWLDGSGNALSDDGLRWLGDSFDANFGSDLQLPHIFPTPDGNVLAEWVFGRRDVALEINLASRQAQYRALNLDNEEEEEEEETLDLSSEEGWSRLNEHLRLLRPTEEAAQS
jgi:hypothetical protein